MNKKLLLIFGILGIALVGIFTFTILKDDNPPQQSSLLSPSPSVFTSVNNKTIELSQVSDHDNSESCWAVIKGKVYDLTNWIEQHPGGSERILEICGTDATTQFTEQHEGETRPQNELDSFYIGEVSN